MPVRSPPCHRFDSSFLDLSAAAEGQGIQLEFDRRADCLMAIPLCEELLTPLCAPALSRRIKTPGDLLQHALIQSEYKQIRWPSWLEANGLPVRTPQGARFDRSLLAIAAAADGLGIALESSRLAEREIKSG